MTEPPARDAPRRSRLSATERKASIVTAATKVFSEVGYQHGKMSDVARLVGVSEPVIFQNFGSKGAVFAAVIEQATGRMIAAMQEVAANGSVGAWLTGLLAHGHRSHAHAHAAHHVLFAEAMSHTTEPIVKEAIRRGHRAVAQAFADLLARGQDEGSVRPDLDPQTTAWWLLSLLATQGFRAATMPNHAHLEAQLGAMTLHMLMTNRHGPG